MKDAYTVLHQLQPTLAIVRGPINALQEQSINAHVMPPEMFAKLVENVKRRGELESLPFCAQPDMTRGPEIVSGHHRVRAARAAGLKDVTYLLDTSAMTRSQIVAKQLAHNALVGYDDSDLLKRLAAMMTDVDDMLESALPQELLPGAEGAAVILYAPNADFQFKTVSFSFLPHQLDHLTELLDSIKGQQDLLGAVPDEQWKPFLQATTTYARFKDVRSVGTVIALLIETALSESKRMEAELVAAGIDPHAPKKRVREKAK